MKTQVKKHGVNPLPWGGDFEGIKVLMKGIDKTKAQYYATTNIILPHLLGYSGNP